ncbi:hypothetical protein SUGI_0189110 [Cryptomeria japonica]|nr:hypothetical protein SUGI_0189110 [Cryptomeria japonica]
MRLRIFKLTREGPVLSRESPLNEYVQRLTLENSKLEEEISHSIRIRCDLVKAAMNVAKEVIQMALVGSSGSSTTPTKDLSSFHGYHRSSLYTKATSVVFMAGITLVETFMDGEIVKRFTVYLQIKVTWVENSEPLHKLFDAQRWVAILD